MASLRNRPTTVSSAAVAAVNASTASPAVTPSGLAVTDADGGIAATLGRQLQKLSAQLTPKVVADILARQSQAPVSVEPREKAGDTIRECAHSRA
jgi:hypothetical protein